MTKHVDAVPNPLVGLGGLLHCPQRLALIVVLVNKLAIGKRIENIAILPVLDAAHGFGRTADRIVNLREHKLAAVLRIAPSKSEQRIVRPVFLGASRPVASMKVGKKSTSETKCVRSTEPGVVTLGQRTRNGERVLAR